MKRRILTTLALLLLLSAVTHAQSGAANVRNGTAAQRPATCLTSRGEVYFQIDGDVGLYDCPNNAWRRVTDHSRLSNLAADDHPQYLNQARADARYSQLGHNHDDRYYTRAEADAQLAAKANAAHTHADATTSAAGFMPAADKTKLDGVQSGATANSTDAQLRDRSTHTGAQAISTVTGLQAALDAKLAAAANLSDLQSAPTARTNLGLGTAATKDVASTGNASSTQVVKGDDTRLSDTRSPSGGAGGVLSGSYPNPGFAVDMATQAELDSETSSRLAGDLNSQPVDPDLTAIAALAPADDDLLQRKAGAWTNRTPTQLKADLAITKSDVGLSAVENTSDLSKPVSTATQAALDGKAAGASSSADSEVVLFSGTTGKALKRATGTGLAYLTSGVLSSSTTSATLASFLSDETGSGSLVFATAPTLSGPRMISAGSIDDPNGNELIKFPSTVANAVNEVNVSNAATGGRPTISVSGGDTNIGMTVTTKGTGNLLLNPGGGLVQFGGTGSSNPAIKFSGNIFQVRKADDSGDMTVAAGTFQSSVGYYVTVFGGEFGIAANSRFTFNNGNITVNGPTKMVYSPQTVTIGDNGAGGSAAPSTLTPTADMIYVTCNDADGCDVTMSETGALSGHNIRVFNVSANVVNFADTAGVTELAGAFAAGQWDSIVMVYVTDRWVETGRSNN